MPKPGQMTEECTLVAWLKQEGDAVAKGDVLFEIETDKSNMDVEAFEEGVLLKRVVQEGETVAVNAVCAYVGEPGEAIPDLPAPLAKAAIEPAPAPAEAPAPPDSASFAFGSAPGPAGSPPIRASTRARSPARVPKAASPSATSRLP
jgi:pyruvate dehydrogenase E2 component (dihydrolipoamide acetyltransferase)